MGRAGGQMQPAEYESVEKVVSAEELSEEVEKRQSIRRDLCPFFLTVETAPRYSLLMANTLPIPFGFYYTMAGWSLLTPGLWSRSSRFLVCASHAAPRWRRRRTRA